jgi:eukaryotic-like serine/threonine-protein kinase
MSLSAGSRLGHYEVLGPLGLGGMGEVWRARDTRLGREVAVKLIRETIHADPEARRRFEQEAQATARLGHPNVVTLYDVGEHEGSPFLVCELLEGETLRARLAGRRLPVPQALEWAAQIARGLASAHDKGILHRDLKPENVFVTREGVLKILDFGLARLRPPEEESGFTSEAATVSRHTRPGTLMGTLAYMSPEQARGLPLDERADLFALGAILYEMLTGRRAFERPTAPDTLSAILTTDPADSGLPEGLPPRVARVLRRCLAKEPAGRFRCAADLAVAFEDPETVAPPPAAVEAGAGWKRRGLGALAVAAVLGAGVAFGVLWHGRAGAEPPELQPLTFGRGPVRGARFTPDGQTVVFSAAWGGEPFRLHMKRLSDPEELTFGPDNTQLFGISSSAELLVLLNRRLVSTPFGPTGTLGRLPLTGGAAREIVDSADAGDWVGKSDEIALVRDVGATRRLELPAGHVVYETAGWLSDLRVRPDGRAAAFVEHPLRESDEGQLVVLDREGRVIRRAGDLGHYRVVSGLAWRPGGSEILWSNSDGEVWAAPGSGPARVVLRIPAWAVLHDLSSSGLALVAQDSRRVAAVVGRPGLDLERDLSWLSWSLAGRISPDGRRLLFTEFSMPTAPDGTVALRSVDGSPIVRLGEGFGYSLSPDGRWALGSIMSPTTRLILLPTGAGSRRELPRGEIEAYSWADFLPDGRGVVFVGHEPSRQTQLYLQDLAGGRPHRLGTEPIGFGPVLVSPDGAWATTIGLDRRLRLLSVPDGAARLVPGVLTGEQPAGWSGDSRALFVYRFGDQPVRIRRVDVDSGKATVVAEVLPSDPGGIDWIGPFTIKPDGSRFAYSYLRTLSQLFLVRGLEER